MKTTSEKQPLCLAMIVKNEAACIAACLASVRPLITNYVVCDTGSTDGTQDLVRTALEGIPGEVVERPWVDFATNRNEALERALERAPYALIIDADDRLVFPENYRLPVLTADGYTLSIKHNRTAYWRTQIVRTASPLRYKGVLHEVLCSPGPVREERLPGIEYRFGGTGARSQDPEKYRKDAMVLTQGLAGEPENARYAFYLAQSWRDAGEPLKALRAYQHYLTLQGWDEERFVARLEMAKIVEKSTVDNHPAYVVQAYMAAYAARPQRAEPLVYLARYLRTHDRVVEAYPFARTAYEIPRPADKLFIDEDVYAGQAWDEFAVAAYWVGNYRGALEANKKLLAGSWLGPPDRERIGANVRFCQEKLGVKSRA